MDISLSQPSELGAASQISSGRAVPGVGGAGSVVCTAFIPGTAQGAGLYLIEVTGVVGNSAVAIDEGNIAYQEDAATVTVIPYAGVGLAGKLSLKRRLTATTSLRTIAVANATAAVPYISTITATKIGS
jgi:hypothetical protein